MKRLFLIPVLLLGFCSTLLAGKIITVDYSSKTGFVKDIMGVNREPFASRIHGFFDAGITTVRMHDYHGGNDYCFYSNFWNFDSVSNKFTNINSNFDPTNPNDYDWRDFDDKVMRLIHWGFEPYIRIGTSYPLGTILQPMEPPLDPDGINFTKFAELCKQTVKHCNGDWDNGLNLFIYYWEIWNEPDGKFWKGTPLQFYRMFETVIDTLKANFNNLLVGGPGVTPATTIGANKKYMDDFLAYLQSHRVPLDFYSWHLYGIKNPYMLETFAENIRTKLNSYGFGNAESHITEINHVLTEEGGAIDDTPKGSAFYMSLLIAAQKSPIDKLLWYPGNAFFKDDTAKKANYTWGGYALKINNLVVTRTNDLLKVTGEELIPDFWDVDTTNFMILASKSEETNQVYIVISNYKSQISNYTIQVKNLPWRATDEIQVKENFLRAPYDKYTETTKTINGGQNIALSVENMPAPSVLFIRLKKRENSAISERKNVPAHFYLVQNYPNPFNSETTIPVELSRNESAILRIYSVDGCLVRTLFNGRLSSGRHKFHWDGTNEQGEQMASGVYFVQLIQGINFSEKKKLVLIR